MLVKIYSSSILYNPKTPFMGHYRYEAALYAGAG